jgi:hypothetical protein
LVEHYQCMIVYAHQDALIANLAFEVLQEHGIETFIDGSKKVTGKKLGYLKDVAKEADSVLVVASKHSAKSDYCRDEIAVARRCYFIRLDNTIFKGYERELIQQPIAIDKPLTDLHQVARAIRKDILPGSSQESEDQVLSRIIGHQKYIADQMSSEGLHHDLILDGCAEIRPNQMDWPAVRLEDLTPLRGEYVLDHTVKELEKNAVQDYTGERKFLVHRIAEGLTDNKSLRLEGWWVEPRIVVKCGEVFEDVRNRLGKNMRIFDLQHSQIPNFLVVHSVLVTKDRHVVIAQRSGTPYYYPRYWSFSFEEQVNESDGTDVTETTLRGLKEELLGSAINQVGREDVRFESVFREYDLTYHEKIQKHVYVLNTGIVALIKCRTLGIVDVWENWREWRDQVSQKIKHGEKLRPKDRIEFDNVLGLELHPQTLRHALKSSDFSPADYGEALWEPKDFNMAYISNWQEKKWHPSVKLRMVCLFRREFPEEFTDFIDLNRW